MEIYNIFAFALSLFGCIYVAVTALIESAEDIYNDCSEDIRFCEDKENGLQSTSSNEPLVNKNKINIVSIRKHRDTLKRIRYFSIAGFCVLTLALSFASPFIWNAGMLPKDGWWTWSFFIVAFLVVAGISLGACYRFKIEKFAHKIKDDVEIHNGNASQFPPVSPK